MRRLFASRGASAGAASILTLLVVGGGYAIASSGGTISACSHKGTHVLYTGKCKDGDKKLTWNQTGPRGPQGIQGVKGLQGPQGVQGIQGNTGSAGSAVAYAHVLTDGSLDASNSSNVTTSSKGSISDSFCLKTSVSVHAASATTDPSYGGGAGLGGVASVVLAGQDPSSFLTVFCPAGDNVFVQTTSLNATGNSATAMSFWITFN
jgi:hypothetical protein